MKWRQPLVLAIAVLLLSLALPRGATARVQPTLTVTAVSTATSAAGLEVQATVAVTGPVQATRLRLTVADTAAPTRSSLDTALAKEGTVRTFDGTGALAADGSTLITIQTSLGRREPGAYPARIELIAQSKAIAAADFFVSVLSSGSTRATPITLLWPIVERPHRGVDGVFLDDLLAIQLGVDGRLRLLVEQGTAEAIVWVIDPGLVAAIEDMSDGYEVVEGGERVERGPSLDAQEWLIDLRAATAGRDVIVLPFGDPDLVSMADLDPKRLSTARDAGVNVVARVLDRAPATLITDVAWPTGGRVSRELLTTLQAQEYRSTLTTSREMPATGATFTPSSRTTTIETLEPIVADAILSQWLAAGDPVAASRVIAEIATITTERPAQPRHQILLPPRSWNPSPSALALLIEQLRPHLLGWDGLRSATVQARDAFRFTASAYSPSHLNTTEAAWRDVEATQMVLGVSLAESDLLAHGALAASLRENTPANLIAQLRTSSRNLVNRVRVLPGRYTLTAQEQSIPVTVVNDFDYPARVFIQISPHAPRIQARQTPAVEVPARGRTQVLVPINSVATGLVAADAQLLLPTGQNYGDGQVLTFDVRSIGPVANWILLGSTALLALAVALRLTRRIRQVRRERPAPAERD